MTESDSRAVLLLRAFEQTAALPAEDLAWAEREARRRLGEAAPAPTWLAQRARLALGRLGEREPSLKTLLSHLQRPPGRLLPTALLLLAAWLGLVGESLGAGQALNLLAPPMLGLLAWNLLVYIGLLSRLARRRAPRPSHVGQGLGLAWSWLYGRVLSRWFGAAAPARASLVRYGADWLQLSTTLQAARATALLHAGAAVLALAALLAMYGRGLVFDYQAGWDSTFLQAQQVQRLLGALLAPASALMGQPLPDEAGFAALRLSAGGGESAAPWIHRWAITLALLVVLPRAMLAALAWRRARRISANLPLPNDESLRRLLHNASGVRPLANVLSYSYRLDAGQQSALGLALERWLGPAWRCSLQAQLPLGAEDALADWLPAALAADAGRPELLVLLFALIATPERESHGALVAAVSQALAAQPAPRPELRVALDESGFRHRLSGADSEQRRAQRRATWEALLIGHAVVPVYIDLGRPAAIEA